MKLWNFPRHTARNMCGSYLETSGKLVVGDFQLFVVADLMPSNSFQLKWYQTAFGPMLGPRFSSTSDPTCNHGAWPWKKRRAWPLPHGEVRVQRLYHLGGIKLYGKCMVILRDFPCIVWVGNEWWFFGPYQALPTYNKPFPQPGLSKPDWIVSGLQFTVYKTYKSWFRKDFAYSL